MPTKPMMRTGPERGSPEKGTETRSLALRGAAVAEPLQCTKVLSGDFEWPHCGLLPNLKSLANKEGVIYVPAAAVIRNL